MATCGTVGSMIGDAGTGGAGTMMVSRSGADEGNDEGNAPDMCGWCMSVSPC